MRQIIQPVQLPTTDGRELNLLITASTIERVISEIGVNIVGLDGDGIKALPRGHYHWLIALCAVKWDQNRKPRGGWVWDNELQPEIDLLKAGDSDPIVDLFEFTVAQSAWMELINRSHRGLPRMPVPEKRGEPANQNESTGDETMIQ